MSEVMIAKWGNSLGIRIPNSIVKALKLKEGEKVVIKELDNSFEVTKSNDSVENVLCSFYGKSVEDILAMKIKEDNPELDWGEDVGAEVL